MSDSTIDEDAVGEYDPDENVPFQHIRFYDTTGQGQEVRVLQCCAEPTLTVGAIYNATTEQADPTIECARCGETLLFMDIVEWEDTRRGGPK